MGSVITSKKGLLKLVKGQINVEVDGSNQPAKDGEQLPKGAVLHIGENATYEITFDDGTKLSNEVAPSETTAAASGTANEAALDEIQALQDLIASGEDPTQNLPETAAGNTPGSDGNSGYVTLARSGTETIAASGYSTSGQALTGTTVNIPQFTIAADSPSALANDSNTSYEDTVATGNVLDNDTDVDSTLSVVSFEISGTTYAAGTEVTLEGGVLILNIDGSYTFTPNENWNGQVPVITYTTNTGSTATLTINISPVDDPSILANDSATVAEDTAATGNVLDNDSDIDSTLSVVSFTVNGDTVTAGTTVSLEGGSLVINADGSYTFTPNANWNGQVPVITYTTNTGSTATLTINVTPVDDASALANDTNTVDEDTVATGNVLTNDSDVDNTLSVTSFTVSGQTVAAGTTVALEGGSLVINADGSYTFTPNENWNGQVPVITYTTNTGSTATLTINVNPVDDPSILANDSATVAEDTVATGNVLDNDSDIDSTLSVVSFTVNGDTVTAGTTVSLEGGSLVINADGSYTFTPNANWNGQVPVITYTTNTGSTATLTINVTPVDDPSILANDSATVAEDTVATGNVLDNDSDIDSTLSVVSFTVNGDTVTAGTTVALEGGSLVINADGSYTFTPNENWNGTVPVITYTTNTGSTATLTINVTPVDDPVDAKDDEYTVNEDGSVSINLLSNDIALDGGLAIKSINGVTLTGLAQNIAVSNGTVVIAADGSMTFVPNANFNGNISFDYVATDADGDIDTATVSINVNSVDDNVTIVNTVGPLNVYESALINGTGSPSSGQVSAQGNMTITANDGLNRIEITNSAGVTSTLTLAALMAATFSTPIVIAGADGTLYITGYNNGSLEYTYALTSAQTHSSQGNDTLNDNFLVKVIDTDGDTATSTITTAIHDDIGTAIDDSNSVDITVDSFIVSGIEASWSSSRVTGGTNIKTFDGDWNTGGEDNDSARDQLRWGTTDNSKQSGYGFMDNDAALNGQLALNQDIILGTFTHYNYPIDSGTAITAASMQITFSVTDAYGVTTPVTLMLNFSHNETPNSSDPMASRDIVTVGQTSVTFNYQGQVYTVQVIGFKDVNGQLVTSIYTNENAATSYELVVRMVAGTGYTLPHCDGNVLTNDVTGADSGLIIIGAAAGDHTNTGVAGNIGISIVGLYGTLTLDANGNYHYQITANASDVPSGAVETFTYTMRDADGDKSSATLTISVNPVDGNGVPVADSNHITTEGATLNDTFIVINGENGTNQNQLNVNFGGNKAGVITNQSGNDIITSGANLTSYSTSNKQVVSSGDGNDHIETGKGDDVIYAGKTGATGFGSDDSLQLSISDILSHHIMSGGLSTIVDSDGLLLANDVASKQADIVNGGSGNDRIYGQSGSDILYGHTGDDYIDGGTHNDGIRGGEGNDTLIGGLGDDVLRGDSGSDTFVWNKGEYGTDHITDFNIHEDKLDLSDLLQGESNNTLHSYLNFSLVSGSTVIDIDGNKDGVFEQHIVLDGVDLYSAYNTTTETGIINGLLGTNGSGPLIVDTQPVTPELSPGLAPLNSNEQHNIP